MEAIFWAGGALYLLIVERRRGTPEGLARFRKLEPLEAKAVLNGYRGGGITILVGWLGLSCVVAAVIAVIDERWLVALFRLIAVVLLAWALVIHRRTGPVIEREAAARKMPADLPISRRDASETRRQRQRQLGGLAGVSLIIAPVAATIGERNDMSWLLIAGGVATGVGLLALAAFGWASAWVYGDEVARDPKPPRTPKPVRARRG